MRLLLVLVLIFAVSLKNNATELNVVTEHWPPFIIDGAIKGSEISGSATQNVKAVLNKTDLDYSIALYPWARSYHLATSEPNTLIYSIYRTKQREDLFHWFCPIYKSTPIHAYKLKSNALDISSFKALKKGTVGVMRGDNSHNSFLKEGFQEGVNLDVSANEEANVRKLIKGRIDVVIQSKESLQYRLQSLGFSDVEVEAGVAVGKGDNLEHCMALSLDSDIEIIKQVSEQFERWKMEKSF